MFHENTKQIEADCHFIREIVMSKTVTIHVQSKDHIRNVPIKALSKFVFSKFCSELGLLGISHVYSKS